ncbi:MAG: hypothetical protein ACP5E5_13640 [Acidobacteriaceae bacterium]
MENDAAADETPKPVTPPQAGRDPLIRYSVYAALGCAGVCVLFAILYIFGYSLNATLSFERHFNDYLSTTQTGNLSTVLGLHMAQNRMFLQSCGIIVGIFFASVGMALFLVGIHGSFDAQGQICDTATSLQRLAPGAIILLVSMIFVGVTAMHPIELTPAQIGNLPTPAAAPSTASPAPQPSATPAAVPPPPPRRIQTFRSQPEYPLPPATSQSSTNPAPPGTASPALQQASPTASLQTSPTSGSSQNPPPHPAIVAARQNASGNPPSHHFVP